MDNRKKSLLVLVLGGLSGIVFLTLLTSSFYGYVLKKIGVEHAENTRTYRYHYVMIINNLDSQFWNDVYQSVRQEAALHDAYVELKGRNQSSEYTAVDFMDMSIAAKLRWNQFLRTGAGVRKPDPKDFAWERQESQGDGAPA